jgi:hypothetical protein
VVRLAFAKTRHNNRGDFDYPLPYVRDFGIKLTRWAIRNCHLGSTFDQRCALGINGSQVVHLSSCPGDRFRLSDMTWPYQY